LSKHKTDVTTLVRVKLRGTGKVVYKDLVLDKHSYEEVEELSLIEIETVENVVQKVTIGQAPTELKVVE
jgi:hypothetical protein